LPGVPFDEATVLSNDGALCIEAIPKKLALIGSGVIGLEMGSVWRRLGSQVTVVEYLDRITPGLDGEVAKTFQRILAKQGMTFRLAMKVVGVERKNGALQVSVEPAAGGPRETIETDIVLSSIGRRPFTEGLGLDKVGLKPDARGRLVAKPMPATRRAGLLGNSIVVPVLEHILKGLP
jgi:dihydrolipoamide dehydrogenase